MNTPLFIARKYLFAKRSLNVVNLISIISVIGVMVSTIALVVVLSGFNGMEKLVINMMDAFQPELVIEPTGKKVIFEDEVDLDAIRATEGVAIATPVIEEMALFNYGDKWAVGKVLGVDSSYASIIDLNSYLLDDQFITRFGRYDAVGGAKILQDLNVPPFYEDVNRSQIKVYSPVKSRSAISTKPFEKSLLDVKGRFNYNPQADGEYVFMNYDVARHIFQLDKEFHHVAIRCSDMPEKVKAKLQAVVGEDLKIKTRREQNEIIYKTSELEKVFTIGVLGFIFILSTFNIISSLLMILLDKKDDIFTLRALGITQRQTEKVFRWTGIQINFIGAILGLAVGYGLVFLQQKYGFIKAQGLIVDSVPVQPLLGDFFLIVSIVIGVGFLTIHIPVKYFVKQLFK